MQSNGIQNSYKSKEVKNLCKIIAEKFPKNWYYDFVKIKLEKFDFWNKVLTSYSNFKFFSPFFNSSLL